MYWHDVSSWDWVSGTFLIGFWIVPIGVLIYFTVKPARGDRERRSHP